MPHRELDPPTSNTSPPPDYGPQGYLPPRAAKRARKIVLREQMGLGWPLAALAASVVVLVVGTAFLLRSGPPGPPFVSAGSIDQIEPSSAQLVRAGEEAHSVLVVRAGGRVRTFAPPPAPVDLCQESRRLESAPGQVWTLDGVLVGGDGASLQPLTSSVYQGVLYVDPTSQGPPLPVDPRGETVTCLP